MVVSKIKTQQRLPVTLEEAAHTDVDGVDVRLWNWGDYFLKDSVVTHLAYTTTSLLSKSPLDVYPIAR